MTLPRRQLVSLEDTAYYHCTSRCVRGARLLGGPSRRGRRRRGILLDRLRHLTRIFAIEVAAYAILHNHYHLVLRIDRQRALDWSDHEVARRWCTLYSRSPLARRFLENRPLTPEERQAIMAQVPVWRERLFNLSWFMRSLNEYVARRFNREDGKSGRFWQGRFHSQALLDNTALLACMTYVDLNPVRAGMAITPEGSDFTSVQQRIRLWKEQHSDRANGGRDQTVTGPDLEPLPCGTLPITLQDYLELVDWTGRVIRKEGAAAIPSSLPPLFERSGLSGDQWIAQVNRFKRPRRWIFGPPGSIRKVARRLGKCWLRGVGDPESRMPVAIG